MTGPSRGRDRAGARGVWWYVAGIAVFQLLALVAVLWLGTTQWFLRHDGYPGIYQQGVGERLSGANCDVLLYGDSTAQVALDPAVVQQITGLKACNVAEGSTVQAVVGADFPLESYLRRNKRPKYLVAMYTPVILEPEVRPFTAYDPGGVAYALEYDHSLAFWKGFLKRREWVIAFSLWAGSAMVTDAVTHVWPGAAKPFTDTRAQRDGRMGIWTYPLPPETHCIRNMTGFDPATAPRHADQVEEFRRKYSVGGTKVIVDVAPIADCDAFQNVWRSRSEGLHDNKFETLPIQYFNEGDVHPGPEGARHVSEEVGHQLLEMMKEDENGKKREPNA